MGNFYYKVIDCTGKVWGSCLTAQAATALVRGLFEDDEYDENLFFTIERDSLKKSKDFREIEIENYVPKRLTKDKFSQKLIFENGV